MICVRLVTSKNGKHFTKIIEIFIRTVLQFSKIRKIFHEQWQEERANIAAKREEL